MTFQARSVGSRLLDRLRRRSGRGWLGVAVALLLAACGSGGGGSGNTPQLQPTSGAYRVEQVRGLGFESVAVDIAVSGVEQLKAGGNASSVTMTLSSSDGRLAEAEVTVTAVSANHLEGTVELPAAGRQATRTVQAVLDLLLDGVRLQLIYGGETVSADGGDLPSGALTLAQLSAGAAAAEALSRGARVLGLLTSLAESQGKYPGVDGTRIFGTCPQVTATRTGSRMVATFDYGTGCTNAFTAGALVAGAFVVGADDDEGELTFNGVSLDGRPVTGRVGGSFRTRQTRQTIPLDATVDYNLAGLGSVKGPVTAAFNADGRVQLANATLTVRTEEGTIYEFVVTGLMFDPVQAGAFVPFQGSTRVTLPDPERDSGTLTVNLTFSEASVGDRVVAIAAEQGESWDLGFRAP